MNENCILGNENVDELWVRVLYNNHNFTMQNQCGNERRKGRDKFLSCRIKNTLQLSPQS